MYKSSKDDIEWMDKERTWILIESSTAKIAICCIYMAVESSTSSPVFKSNQALLEQVVQLEMVDFSSKDYSLLWAGDMNTHFSSLEYFPLTKKHKLNNNGKLMMDVAKSMKLTCLNPLHWNGTAEEKPTYQRELGNRYVSSMIDYALAGENAMEYIEDFTIDDDGSFSLESDHASLVLTLTLPWKQAWKQHKRESNKIFNVTNYRKILNKVFSEEKEKQGKRSIKKQNSFFTSTILSAVSKTTKTKRSPARNETRKQRSARLK